MRVQKRLLKLCAIFLLQILIFNWVWLHWFVLVLSWALFCSCLGPRFGPVLDFVLFLSWALFCSCLGPCFVPILGLVLFLSWTLFCFCLGPCFVPVLVFVLFLSWALFCSCLGPSFVPVSGLVFSCLGPCSSSVFVWFIVLVLSFRLAMRLLSCHVNKRRLTYRPRSQK